MKTIFLSKTVLEDPWNEWAWFPWPFDDAATSVCPIPPDQPAVGKSALNREVPTFTCEIWTFAPSKILSQELGWSAIRHYHLALLLQCCEQLGVHLRPWAIESPWSSRVLGAKFLQGCFGRIVDINGLLPNAKLFTTKHATENWEVAQSGPEADLQASLPLISDQDQNFGSSQLLAPMLQHAFRETPTHQVDAVWGPMSIPGTLPSLNC